MRQAGILAAAGIHALEQHVARLADDHANAKRFAALLAGIPAVSVDPRSVETNIVFFDIRENGKPIRDIVAALKQRGVLLSATGGRTCRAVTHLDVSSGDIERAAALLADVLRQR